MPEPLPAPDECANCGARIPRGAKSCPECGADERTGWRESSVYDGLDLPASAFDEDDEAAEARRRGHESRRSRIFGAIGIVLLILAVVYAFVLR